MILVISVIGNCLKMIRKNSQSTLEYVLVLTVILLAIIAAVAPRNGPIRSGLRGYFTQLGAKIGGIMDGF